MAGRKFHLKNSGYRALVESIDDTHETLLDELYADHAIAVTWQTEITADHATTVTWQTEMTADHATQITWCTEVDADHDTMNDYLDFVNEADGITGGEFTMAAAAAVTYAVTTEAGIHWRRAGVKHFRKNLPTTLTLDAPSTTTIANTKFGAWRVVMDDLGAITSQAANATTMQFASAEDALLNCAAIAPTASTVTIGYIVLENGTGVDFTIGTTDTNTGSVTSTFFYEMGPRKQITGMHTALGSSVVADTSAATWSSGTIDVQLLGLNVAQIGAITNQAMDDADTIATTKAGGWLLVTNYAGTGVYALAQDGIAGSVSAMSSDTTAAVDTLLDTLTDNLPGQFCPIAKIVVDNQAGGTFTAGTTNWDAASVTTTVTDATVGTWDRTASTGFDSHKINPPAVPASITAPLVETLTAPTIATLTAPTMSTLTASQVDTID